MSVGGRSRDGSEYKTNEEIHHGCGCSGCGGCDDLRKLENDKETMSSKLGPLTDQIETLSQIKSNQEQLTFRMLKSYRA